MTSAPTSIRPTSGVAEDNRFLDSTESGEQLPSLFKVQLRAILRAAVRMKLKIMFPIIVDLEELRRARELLAEAQGELFREGLEHNPHRVGFMVEVPVRGDAVRAALASARSIFPQPRHERLDPVSAGRRPQQPAPRIYYEALHPAVLSAIAEVVNVARAAGKEVCICGEMASDPLATLLLVGIGLDLN